MILAERWRLVSRCGLLLLLCLLNACATTGVLQGSSHAGAHWQGRLAVKVFGNPVQAWSANFELAGDPQEGELVLSTPLGSTLAHVQWSDGKAVLNASGDQQEYDNLDELVLQATGTHLPVKAMFAWLSGEDAESSGWEIDSGGMQNGRLTVRQTAKEPQAEIKIVLDN